MNIVSAYQLSKTVGAKELFQELSFGLSNDEKIALTGKNGSGKSTLMRILAGEEESDAGEVTWNKSVSFSYFSQNPQLPEDLTIEEFFQSHANPAASLLLQYERALQNGNAAKVDELEAKLIEMNAWSHEASARSLLKALGINNFTQKISELSGGMRRKVALARFFLLPADCLLMDEPTNHLDLTTVAFLERLLIQYRGCLLIITHDRYFLENVTRAVWEIDKAEILRYQGTYENFLVQKAEREAIEERAEANRQKKLKSELEWLQRQPKARGTKSRARVDSIHRLAAQEKKTESELAAIAQESARQGKTVLNLVNISRKIGEETILASFSYAFTAGERLGIIGENGSGKSTLLNIIAGNIESDSGSIIYGVNTKIGYFSQHAENLKQDLSVLGTIQEYGREFTAANGKKVRATEFLSSFLFPPSVQHRKVSELSGGERRRLYLLTILVQGPNLLLLDEPTNDLDMHAMKVLEDYLIDYPGTLLVVSHDRFFLDRLSRSFLLVEKGKALRLYSGSASEAAALLAEEKELTTKLTKKPAKENPAKPAGKKKLSYMDQRRYDQLQSEIPALEQELQKLQSLLSGEVTDAEEIARLSGQYEEKEAELLEKFEEAEEILSKGIPA